MAAYYRLKQIDFNGTFQYNKTIKSSALADIPHIKVAIFPNPSQGQIKIEVNKDDIQVVQVTLFDKQGKKILIYASSEYLEDKAIISLNLSTLPADIYFVHTLVNQKTIVSKVAKL